MPVSEKVFKVVILTAITCVWASFAFAADKSAEVHLFTDDKYVTVIVLNPFDEPVEYLDSFNLGGDGPIGMYFKVSSDPRSGVKESTDEWLWPGRYSSWTFPVSGEPVTLAPHSFARKSWPIHDFVRPALECAETGPCRRYVKFSIKVLSKETFRGDPPGASYRLETPWLLYKLKNE